MPNIAKRMLWLACLGGFLLGLPCPAPSQSVRGIDASFQAELRAAGVIWRDSSGNPLDLPAFCRASGVNLARFRIWNAPSAGNSSLAAVKTEARRWKAAGFQLLIDFHYSDDWADPGKQTKPAAWAALSGAPLEAAVYDFTLATLTELRAARAAPDFVQLGNEITSGMLWDDGRVGGSFDTSQQWAKLGRLLLAGVQAMRDATPATATLPRVILHIDRGGDLAGARWFYSHIQQLAIPYDVIGLSYYPFWHGTLGQLQSTLAGLTADFDKPVLIAETAYPWTFAWQDNTQNVLGAGAPLLPNSPATPAGQQRFLEDLRATLQSATAGRVLGFVYWAPDWVVGGSGGSTWENLTLFDAQQRALPGWSAFGVSAARHWAFY